MFPLPAAATASAPEPSKRASGVELAGAGGGADALPPPVS